MAAKATRNVRDCRLATLAGFVAPGIGFIAPVVIWQIKKNEIPSVEAHGKAALNFQITLLIATLATVGLMLLLWLFCIGWLLIPVLMALWVAGIVFTVMAGIKANDGKEYNYPFSLKLI